MRERLGFMQGRLSPMVDGRIQAFPAVHWRDEFASSQSLDLHLMEWTIDHDGFAANPLMTETGRAEIARLQEAHGLQIKSLTADNMMQAPFWKADHAARDELLGALAAMIDACGKIGIRLIVAPLVDNGSLTRPEHEESLFSGLQELLPLMTAANVGIVFESDYEPTRLAQFIARYPEPFFGINFDMGNSAALGWEPETEVPVLASRILNVHVKDRPRGGSTVPFGQGAVKFDAVFGLLKASGYAGNYIIQGARAADGDDAGALRGYADLVERLL